MGDNSHSPFFDVYADSFVDELLEHYFVSFIEAGGNYSDYEDMTLEEVKMVVKGYENRMKNQRRLQADLDFRLANVIGANVNCLFSKTAKPPTFDKVYGDIFAEEEQQNDGNNNAVKDDTDNATLRLHLMRMEAFVNNHNKKFKNKKLLLKI